VRFPVKTSGGKDKSRGVCLKTANHRKSPQITANQPQINHKSPQITVNQAQHNVILPENRKSPQITADKADGQSLTLCVLQIHLLNYIYLLKTIQKM